LAVVRKEVMQLFQPILPNENALNAMRMLYSYPIDWR